jgi:hypothetical protein
MKWSTFSSPSGSSAPSGSAATRTARQGRGDVSGSTARSVAAPTPFWREHSEGHGLGLAIVRAITYAHGATLTARARLRGGLDIRDVAVVGFRGRRGPPLVGQSGEADRGRNA